MWVFVRLVSSNRPYWFLLFRRLIITYYFQKSDGSSEREAENGKILQYEINVMCLCEITNIYLCTLCFLYYNYFFRENDFTKKLLHLLIFSPLCAERVTLFEIFGARMLFFDWTNRDILLPYTTYILLWFYSNTCPTSLGILWSIKSVSGAVM